MTTEFDKALLQYCSQDVLNEATKLTSDKSTTLDASFSLLQKAASAHKIIEGERGLRQTLEAAIEDDGEFTDDEMAQIERMFGHLAGGETGELITAWVTVRSLLGSDKTDAVLQHSKSGMGLQAIADVVSAIYNSFEDENRVFAPQKIRGDEQEALKKIRKKAAESGLDPSELRGVKGRDQERDNYEMGRY